MSRGIINGLFGILFNVAAAALVMALLLLAGALVGGIDMVWLSRTGIILQILGISLFVLEFMGVAQQGQSPLRWWLGKLAHEDGNTSMPSPWPRQMLLVVGAGSLVMGLLLQLLSSWG